MSDDNRIALALEKRARWREKVKSSSDAVRSIQRTLQDESISSRQKKSGNSGKKIEGWMQMEVRSGSNLSTYWQRFYFTLYPGHKCLSWFTNKDKEVHVASIYLSPSCRLEFRLSALEDREDKEEHDDDEQSFRIRGVELPANWNKIKWSTSDDEDTLHVRPETRLFEWRDAIKMCCQVERTNLENTSSEDRTERVMEVRKRKLDTIEYVLRSEIQKQTQIVNALHHRRKHMKESGSAQEIQSVEIWFRPGSSGSYRRQVFRVTRGTTFDDLTSTAKWFWRKSMPKSIGTRCTVALKDPTGSTWGSDANVQIELSNRKRITEHEPRLYLSLSKLNVVTPHEICLEKNQMDGFTLSSSSSSLQKRTFRAMTTVTETKKNSIEDNAERYKSQIFESQSEKIIFVIELVGVALFLIFTYLNMYVENVPQMASYHASKYVKHKLVEATWQECFDSASNTLLAGLYTPESLQTCRKLSFDSIFEVSQILDWAEGVWFFEFGITGSPSDKEFFSSINTSNYQAIGNVNSSIYTHTGTQILGEMLIWQVRNSDNSTDLDNPSSEAFGSCNTTRSSNALCWSYETGVFPKYSSSFSSFNRDYDGDGFVIRIPASPQNYFVDTLNEIQEGDFFDAKTRAVGFTANLWSENSGTLFSPQMVFEMDVHGAIISNYRVPMFRAMGDRVQTLIVVIQIVCLLTCLAPLYVITRNAISRFKERRKENLDADQTLVQPGWWCSEQFFKSNWYTRIDPAFHALWGSLQGSFLFQAGFVVVYVLVVANSFERSAELSDLKSELRAGTGYIDVENAQYYHRNVTVLRGFAFLFAFIKSIQFLHVIPAARPFVRTLSDSFPNLVAGFIILMIFRIALVAMAMSLYGVRTWNFNTFVNSLFTMFEVLLGNIRGGKTIWGEHFILFEFTLWILYIVVEFYTWYMLLLVVLTFSYKKNFDEFLRNRREGKIEWSDVFPCFSKSSSDRRGDD